MRNIVLQRRIAVRCWNVLGMVAKSSKRPELMPVLLRARERNQTSAEDVAEHLFFEQRSRRVVAERLLRIAASYGLLAQNERWFMLTDAGVAALNSEQIFVPERGSWTIWASNDPLFDYPVLRVDPWNEPTALDDVQRGRNKDGDAREFVDVPRTLREAVGRVAAPPCGGGGLLRVDEVADKAEEVEPGDDLKVVWNVGERKMRLEGSLRGARLDTVLDAPGITREDVWQQLLEAEGLWSSWDRTRSALRVGFEETNDRERESLLRDLAITAPTLSDLGKFDALAIQDVPLHARTANDAGHWAAWRLQSRLRDYATRERFDAWTKEATEPFATYRISVPSRADLAKDAWARRGDRPSPIAWHLAAAEDWSL
jgi:hypothetical protein